MESAREYAFTGEEFASLFCRYGDHFSAPFFSPFARERARKKLAARAKGKEGCALQSRLSYRAGDEGLVLHLELSCELVEKSAEGYCLSYLTPPGDSPLLTAEAWLAGAVLCRRRKLGQVILERCICDPYSGRPEYKRELRKAEELEEYLSERLGDALSFLRLTLPKEGNLRFPYASLREGQRELMDECYGALKEKRCLFACAPTGVGKTLSFLYPALKAVEKGKARRVLFLTPKGSTQRQVRQAAEALEEKGGDARSIVLFARQSRCAHRGRCLREGCSRSPGHEGRLLPALRALFGRYLHFDGETLSEIAGEYAVCPFELSTLAARFCKIVVGDYNFVFDDKARLSQFADGQCIVLVDEAHNLPDRVRESLSYRLGRETCQHIREQFGGAGEELLAQLEARFHESAALAADGAPPMEHQPPEDLQEMARRLWLVLRPRWDGKNEAQGELLYTLRGFERACRRFDWGYVCAHSEDGGVKLCLCDPAESIRQSAGAFGTAVYFSATLLPRDYFFSVLGGTPRDRFYEGDSPFDPSRLLVCAAPLATALANRGESLRSLCRYVGVACEKPGRYLMFFPSFEYLSRVESALRAFCPSLVLLVQRPEMSHDRRQSFLARMDEGAEGKSLLGLCVLGGLFGEGVELKEHSLDGVIVAGTGMAPPSLEREAQCAYYGAREENGKVFSYLLPGFHKVLQAVGRLIRKETDRGFALLCDRRYADGSYASLYPSHWNECVVCPTPAHLRDTLRRFWDGE